MSFPVFILLCLSSLSCLSCLLLQADCIIAEIHTTCVLCISDNSHILYLCIKHETLLANSPRRWSSVNPALGQCFVCRHLVPEYLTQPTSHAGTALGQCWQTVRSVTHKCITWLPVTQRTGYTDPLLAQCWAIVCDSGPTLSQHRSVYRKLVITL